MTHSNPSKSLNILFQPCDSGTCPALYTDEAGRVFVQGSKLSRVGQNMTVPEHEEVVEISPDLIAFLKAN